MIIQEKLENHHINKKLKKAQHKSEYLTNANMKLKQKIDAFEKYYSLKTEEVKNLM